MQLIANGHTLTIDTPLYGYEVECFWSMLIHKVGKQYRWFDNVSTNDYRVLNMKNWVTQANMEYIESWFSLGAYFRSEDITLRLGASPTGFYPAGPDHGDVGDFTIRLLNMTQSGILDNPYRHFQPEFKFVIVDTPEYEIPALKVEGNITIGDHTNGFRYPSNGFKPMRDQGQIKTLSRSGVPHDIDSGQASDTTTTDFTIETCAENMANLIDEIIASRCESMDFILPSGMYPFGAMNHTSDNYNVHCINESFVISHNRYEQFTLPLNFWFDGYLS